MPVLLSATNRVAQDSLEAERAAFLLKAMQMKLHRRAAMPDDIFPHILIIKVIIPEDYFNLHVQALSNVTFIEADPRSLHPSEQEALDANHLLSDLCLILTSQNNTSVDYRYILKAVAIALRDEYQHFSKRHLEIQSRTSLVDDTEQNAGCTQDATRLSILFPSPGHCQYLIYSVFVQNTPLEHAERQVLVQHRARVVETLVLTGQEYPDLPIGLLYKAVARAFKPANLKPAKRTKSGLLPFLTSFDTTEKN